MSHPMDPRRRQLLKMLGMIGTGTALSQLMPTMAQSCTDSTYFPPDYPVDCAPPAPKAPPVPFTPYSGPVVDRKSAFTLTSMEVSRLKAAYQALRDLTETNPDDPRGWLHQAAVHCWYCGGGSDGQAGPEIHGSWYFLPWHRAFLYFHERILATLIDDPSFRLPYWDWDRWGLTPSRQMMPPPYSLGGQANSLFDALRGQSPSAQLPPRITGPLITQKVLTQTEYQTFGGGTDNAGQLELLPHNHVHVWSGTDGNTMPNCGTDMGVLATAARDPMFFTHHSNVDRFWDMWLAQSKSNQNPTDPTWSQQSWTFYDENANWVSIQVQDVIHTTHLGYRYDTLATTLPTKVAATPQRITPQIPSTVLVSGRNGIALDPKGTTHAVPLPAPGQNGPLKATKGKLALKITGIHVPLNQSAEVFVFINKPDVNVKTLDAALQTASFAGAIGAVQASLGPEGHHRHARTFDAVVELSEATQQLILKDRKISVTLVPVDAFGRTPVRLNVTYQRIELIRL